MEGNECTIQIHLGTKTNSYLHLQCGTHWIRICSLSIQKQLFSERTVNTNCTWILQAVLLNVVILDPSYLGYSPSWKMFWNSKNFLFLKYCTTDINIQSSFQCHFLRHYKALLLLNEMSNIYWARHHHCYFLAQTEVSGASGK